MWFINFFVDIANIIIAWVPLICYLGGAALLIGAIVYFSRLGNPAKQASGDALKAGLCFFVAVLLVSFPAYVNGWNVTMGLPSRVHAGGTLFTYRTTVPGFMGQTPQDWFVGMVTIFMPFFRAFGLLSVLRGVWLLKDGAREGVNVTWPYLAYTLAGVMLMNIDTIVPEIFTAGA